MPTRTISTRLAVEGEAQYKQAIASCNAELKTLKSDLALVESEFRSNANSMDALTAKGSALQSVYDKQLEKVTALEAALLNCRNAVSEYAERQDDLKAKLETIGEEIGSLDEASKKAGEQWLQYAEKIKKSESALEALKRKSGDTSDEQGKLENAIAKAKAQMEKLETSTGGTAKQTAELIRQNKQLNSEYADNEARLAAAERGVQNWQHQINSAKIELNGLSDKIAQNDQYLREAEESADGCARSIDQYGKEVKQAGEASREFADGTQGSREAINQLAAALAAAGVAKTVKEIADELLSCANAAAGFETAMAKVSTLAGQENLGAMKAQLVELSGETGTAVGSLAEAAYQAMSAGVDAANVVDFVSTAVKTSAAGFTDASTAVDVLTTALNAYKLEGSETERVASMLVKTQDEGKTSVGELAQNMGRVIPQAAAYNVSLGNLTTAYALLTKNGTNTAIATTNLGAMLTELSKKGSTVADTLQNQTGKSFAELVAGGENLGGVLTVLADSVDGNATAFSNLWSSTTAGQAALSLLNSGAEEFTRTLGIMETSSGAVERNFQTMADTTEFARQRMANAADNLRIAIGDQLNPALEKLYDTGADAFVWAADFVEEYPWVAQAITGAVTAVGLLTVGIAGYSAVTAAAKAAQDALNISMGLCPLVAVTAAVGALVFAIGGFIASVGDANEDTKNLIKSLNESKQAYDDLMAAMGREQAGTASAAAALKGLLTVEGKSASQKEEIKRLVDQLNAAIPGLNLAYDAEKDAIENVTGAELDASIARAQAQEEHEAQMERLAELRTEGAAIADQLREAEEKLGEAQANNHGEVQVWLDGAGGVYPVTLDAGAEAARSQQAAVDDLTAAYQANAAEIAALEAEADAYAQGQGAAAQAVQEARDRVDELTAKMTELETEYQASYDAAYASIDGQLGLFNKLDGEAKTSIDELINTLAGQASYMEDYAANIQRAMEMGVDEGLLAKLSDGAQESAQYLDAIVKGGGESVAELNEQFAKVEEGKQKFSDTVAQMERDFAGEMDQLTQDLDGAKEELAAAEETFFKIGQNDIQGLINGAASMKDKLKATYGGLAAAAVGAYLLGVDQHSPSKKFVQAAQYDVQGLIVGAEREKARLADAYTELARTAVESYRAEAEKGMAEVSNALRDLDSFFAIRADVGDLEYKLWERTQGKNVSDMDKYARQLELLNRKQADQVEMVKAAEDAYRAAVKQYGEGTTESLKYQKTLLEEKLAWQDLLDEIETVSEAKRKAAGELSILQAQMEWRNSGLGRAMSAASGTGYITPYEAAAISGASLVNAADFNNAYGRAAQTALDSVARWRAGAAAEPPRTNALEQQLQTMTAAVVNAVSAVPGRAAGPTSFTLVFPDGTEFASYYFDPMTQYAEANGTPILNPRR